MTNAELIAEVHKLNAEVAFWKRVVTRVGGPDAIARAEADRAAIVASGVMHQDRPIGA